MFVWNSLAFSATNSKVRTAVWTEMLTLVYGGVTAALLGAIVKFRKNQVALSCLCLYVCLCLSVSVCLYVCLSMSVYMSACLCLYVCLSMFVSMSGYMSVCLCLCIYVCLYVCLPVGLSVCLYVRLSFLLIIQPAPLRCNTTCFTWS
jgi:hypothetical protein